ncbi:MAG: peptidylprolyl isomerase [Casimicrobiaceae bacterium]
MTLKARFAAWAALACWLGVASVAGAADFPRDHVLAQHPGGVVTIGDYQDELAALPENMRFEFALVPKRVVGLIDGLLYRKSLAAEARRAGLIPDPKAVEAGPAYAERALAADYVKKIDAEVGAEFDAKAGQFAGHAREIYLIDARKYMTPGQVSVSHIFFSNESRGKEEARKAAEDAASKLAAGVAFDALAGEVSDDTKTRADGGRLGYLTPGEHDKALIDAASRLAQAGAVSAPVATPSGYHLVRLDERRAPRQLSFDEARPAILADLRAQYVERERDARLLPLRRDPATKVDEIALQSLITHRGKAKTSP